MSSSYVSSYNPGVLPVVEGEIVRTCMNDLRPPHVLMNCHVFQRARGWIFVSDGRSMRMMCPLVRKERCRWAARVLKIQSYMISTLRCLSGEDMTVQNPSDFFLVFPRVCSVIT